MTRSQTLDNIQAVTFARAEAAAYCRATNTPQEDSAVIAACDAYLRLVKGPVQFTIKSLPKED